jgi:predicted nucleotidyltransferase
MNIEMLEKTNWIIYKVLTGSRQYGTYISTSDFDYRGIFILPLNKRISLKQSLCEVGQEKPVDIKYYEVEKFMQLAKDCNPSLIEFLFAPKDCIEICTPLMQKLFDNRHLFISKKAYHTFTGYSHSQIIKCRGQNKMVNHPEMSIKPKKEDFCWITPHISRYESEPNCLMPSRPMPLKKAEDLFNIRLNEYHCSALEHVSNTYRLYYYGKDSKGIFRGDDMLVCENIPIEDEIPKYYGLLVYNKQEFEKALNEHRKYNDWIKNRNDARWIDQEKGLLSYDSKNLSHCMRLLISGENILKHGEPIVRFEGEQLQLLKDIRAGKYKYEVIMEMVDKRMKELESLYETSTIPHSPDIDKIDELYREIVMDFT